MFALSARRGAPQTIPGAQPLAAEAFTAWLRIGLSLAPDQGFTSQTCTDALELSSPGAALSYEDLSASCGVRAPEGVLVDGVVRASNNAAAAAMLALFDKKAAARETPVDLLRFPKHLVPTRSPIELPSLSGMIAGGSSATREAKWAAEVLRIGTVVKLAALAPHVHHWPQAVHLEVQPRHIGYSVKGLAEHADNVAYHAERMAKLQVLVTAGRSALAAAAINGGGVSGSAELDFEDDGATPAKADRLTEALLAAHVPLSSGPQNGLGWYAERAKVAGMYGLCVTSMVGESSDLIATRGANEAAFADGMTSLVTSVAGSVLPASLALRTPRVSTSVVSGPRNEESYLEDAKALGALVVDPNFSWCDAAARDDVASRFATLYPATAGLVDALASDLGSM